MGAYLDQHPLAVLGWLAVACIAAGAVYVLGVLAAAPIAAERRARRGLDSRPDMTGCDRLLNAIRDEQPKGDQP